MLPEGGQLLVHVKEVLENVAEIARQIADTGGGRAGGAHVWRSGTGEVAGGEVGLEHFGCMVGGLGRGVDAVVCLSSF